MTARASVRRVFSPPGRREGYGEGGAHRENSDETSRLRYCNEADESPTNATRRGLVGHLHSLEGARTLRSPFQERSGPFHESGGGVAWGDGASTRSLVGLPVAIPLLGTTLPGPYTKPGGDRKSRTDVLAVIADLLTRNEAKARRPYCFLPTAFCLLLPARRPPEL